MEHPAQPRPIRRLGCIVALVMFADSFPQERVHAPPFHAPAELSQQCDGGRGFLAPIEFFHRTWFRSDIQLEVSLKPDICHLHLVQISSIRLPC